jgi:hypothetical protein
MSNTNHIPQFSFSEEAVTTGYNIIIVSVAYIRYEYMARFKELKAEYRLHDTDHEPLYDWLVKESLSKYLAQRCYGGVESHHRHDVYKCVHDQLGTQFFNVLANHFELQKLSFLRREILKVLVAGDNVIIARKSPYVGV